MRWHIPVPIMLKVHIPSTMRSTIPIQRTVSNKEKDEKSEHLNSSIWNQAMGNRYHLLPITVFRTASHVASLPTPHRSVSTKVLVTSSFLVIRIPPVPKQVSLIVLSPTLSFILGVGPHLFPHPTSPVVPLSLTCLRCNFLHPLFFVFIPYHLAKFTVWV